MITSEIIIAVIGLISTLLTGVVSYSTGRRQRENEADRTAYEAYSFALESLRKEFEVRIEGMRMDYEQLQKENEELKRKIFELEKRNLCEDF